MRHINLNTSATEVRATTRKLRRRWSLSVGELERFVGEDVYDEIGGGMFSKFETTIKKTKLMEILRENMGKHQAIFEEAVTGYRKKLIEIIEEMLAAAREGKKVSHHINLVQPVNHVRDYQRLLQMMEMGTEQEITLNEAQFAQYVEDGWNWKHQFVTSNAQYSKLARDYLSEVEHEEY